MNYFKNQQNEKNIFNRGSPDGAMELAQRYHGSGT